MNVIYTKNEANSNLFWYREVARAQTLLVATKKTPIFPSQYCESNNNFPIQLATLRVNPVVGAGKIAMTSCAGIKSKFGLPLLKDTRERIAQLFKVLTVQLQVLLFLLLYVDKKTKKNTIVMASVRNTNLLSKMASFLHM